ncbi:MAG: phosphate ABC transporter ATP-binding protein PstB [Trueperaceae bacterium]|nr:phosphate ABC transporter ATP-binding protein PstB [Trueperaceae bacterium]
MTTTSKQDPKRDSNPIHNFNYDHETVRTDAQSGDDVAVGVENFNLWYGDFQALHHVSLTFPKNQVTALIGASGCGKTTLLRSINRMNDLIPIVKIDGEISYEGVNIYDRNVDPVEVRRRIGMVFQKPNPFPKSIFDNVAYGPRLHGYDGDLKDLVERSLQKAALWDEVKDKIKQSGLGLSGGQQQRLCIARAMATEPDVILMDEPTSALDPMATDRIEELIHEIKKDYTVIIVTHNMQQAGRVSDRTAFMHLGVLIEEGPTDQIFTNPKHDMTERYVSGRFG